MTGATAEKAFPIIRAHCIFIWNKEYRTNRLSPRGCIIHQKRLGIPASSICTGDLTKIPEKCIFAGWERRSRVSRSHNGRMKISCEGGWKWILNFPKNIEHSGGHRRKVAEKEFRKDLPRGSRKRSGFRKN